jgi:thiol-disulfide isomerase/thioredoxin
MFRMLNLALAILVVVSVAAQTHAEDKPAVELKEATIADLTTAIEAHKGKVVVIDCWFLACGPCVKKFPHVVGVHEKLSADGMQLVSLNILTDELKQKPEVLAFLKKQNANFPNYIFNDKQPTIDKWQEKYEAEATPALVVFNRKGAWVKTPESVTEEKDPEKYAVKLTEWIKTLLNEK